jgi:hypothetical protein
MHPSYAPIIPQLFLRLDVTIHTSSVVFESVKLHFVTQRHCYLNPKRHAPNFSIKSTSRPIIDTSPIVCRHPAVHLEAPDYQNSPQEEEVHQAFQEIQEAEIHQA